MFERGIAHCSPNEGGSGTCGMEQKALAEASGVSLPTIQRMEASNGTVRGVIESLTRVIAALEAAGVEFIYEGTTSSGGGRGVRLRRHPK